MTGSSCYDGCKHYFVHGISGRSCCFQDHKRIYQPSLDCPYYKMGFWYWLNSILFPKRNVPPSDNLSQTKAPKKPKGPKYAKD